MESCTQIHSTGFTQYRHSGIEFTAYNDPTKFDYKLIAPNGAPGFANDGRNTDIEFLFEKRMQICAKNRDNARHILDFTQNEHANFIASLIISTDSAKYKVSEIAMVAIYDLEITSISMIKLTLFYFETIF